MLKKTTLRRGELHSGSQCSCNHHPRAHESCALAGALGRECGMANRWPTRSDSRVKKRKRRAADQKNKGQRTNSRSTVAGRPWVSTAEDGYRRRRTDVDGGGRTVRKMPQSGTACESRESRVSTCPGAVSRAELAHAGLRSTL
jgi:hypothetical protein